MVKGKTGTKTDSPVATFFWNKPNKEDRERYIDEWDKEEKYCVDLTQWKETDESRKELEDLAAILITLKEDTEVTLGMDVTSIDTFYACEGALGDRTIPEVIRSTVAWMTIKGAISVGDLLKVINDEEVNFMGDFTSKLFPHRERKSGVIENTFRMCGPELENLCETYERVDGEFNGGKPLTKSELATYQPGVPEETLGIWWSGPENLKLIINKELVAHTLATGKKPKAKKKPDESKEKGPGKLTKKLSDLFSFVSPQLNIKMTKRGFEIDVSGNDHSDEYQSYEFRCDSLEELVALLRQYWAMKHGW